MIVIFILEAFQINENFQPKSAFLFELVGGRQTARSKWCQMGFNAGFKWGNQKFYGQFIETTLNYWPQVCWTSCAGCHWCKPDFSQMEWIYIQFYNQLILNMKSRSLHGQRFRALVEGKHRTQQYYIIIIYI